MITEIPPANIYFIKFKLKDSVFSGRNTQIKFTM